MLAARAPVSLTLPQWEQCQTTQYTASVIALKSPEVFRNVRHGIVTNRLADFPNPAALNSFQLPTMLVKARCPSKLMNIVGLTGDGYCSLSLMVKPQLAYAA